MQFLETLKIEKRQVHNLFWHHQRLNKTRREQLGIQESIDLQNHLQIPENLSEAVYKCRIIYAEKIEKIEFIPYPFPKIHSLKLIEAPNIQYTYKYKNRNELEKLYAQKGAFDDILITQNQYLSDTFYANVILWDGIRWRTPATPLLAGTQRAKLLAEKKIELDEIKREDLKYFKKVGLINAMLDFENKLLIPIRNIVT